MYAGNSGTRGIILYNTDIKGKNAVYGYYESEQICLETGTVEEMKMLEDSHDRDAARASNTSRLLVVMLAAYLILTVAGFVVLPLKIAFALFLFCVLSYFPLLVIINAKAGMYSDPEIRDRFRRHHGCEHAAMSVLTAKKAADLETLRAAQIYDTECGTAYSGYAVAVSLELALLIIFWPGFLKVLGMLAASVILIVIMILVPRINPFTVLQHPVVMQPTEKEYLLAIEIMKKLRELE